MKDLYLLLFPVASGILCSPASTAPVEYVFSASEDITREKRNHLSDDNLERETCYAKQNLCIFKFKETAMHVTIAKVKHR